MLKTAGDILNAVIVRGNLATTSAYYSDAVVRANIQDAYRWATGYKKWAFTEGRQATTFASLITNPDGDLEGVYPEGWRTDSIRFLIIGTKRVQKVNFEDFRIFREETPSGNDRIFSDLGRLYFVNPQIDLSGTVTAYGQFTPIQLDLTDSTSSTGETVFSNNEEEGNEAIVYEALSYCKMKEKKNLGEAEYYHKRATAILDQVWKRVNDEQFAYHTKNRGMFERFDILKGERYSDVIKRDQFNS